MMRKCVTVCTLFTMLSIGTAEAMRNPVAESITKLTSLKEQINEKKRALSKANHKFRVLHEYLSDLQHFSQLKTQIIDEQTTAETSIKELNQKFSTELLVLVELGAALIEKHDEEGFKPVLACLFWAQEIDLSATARVALVSLIRIHSLGLFGKLADRQASPTQTPTAGVAFPARSPSAGSSESRTASDNHRQVQSYWSHSQVMQQNRQEQERIAREQERIAREQQEQAARHAQEQARIFAQQREEQERRQQELNRQRQQQSFSAYAGIMEREATPQTKKNEQEHYYYN